MLSFRFTKTLDEILKILLWFSINSATENFPYTMLLLHLLHSGGDVKMEQVDILTR